MFSPAINGRSASVWYLSKLSSSDVFALPRIVLIGKNWVFFHSSVRYTSHAIVCNSIDTLRKTYRTFHWHSFAQEIKLQMAILRLIIDVHASWASCNRAFPKFDRKQARRFIGIMCWRRKQRIALWPMFSRVKWEVDVSVWFQHQFLAWLDRRLTMNAETSIRHVEAFVTQHSVSGGKVQWPWWVWRVLRFKAERGAEERIILFCKTNIN